MTADNTTHTSDWSLYPYNPVRPLPIIFAVAFLTCGTIMLYQCIARYGLKRYTFTMTSTSLVWAAGFACRMASIYHDQDIEVFVAQYTLLFIGPPLFAGAEYFIFGRVLAYVPYHTPIHPGRVLSSFLIVDAVVEVVAINGATAMASSKSVGERNSGLIRMEVALILQSVLEVAFLSGVNLVERRCRRARQFPRNLQIVCYILYVTSLMMLVRCVYRIVEGFETMKCAIDAPNCGTVDRYEWFFYVFEVANIFLFVFLLTIFPPGKYLPPSDKVYLDPVDGTERVGPGYANADKRPFLVTVIDPFNIVGIVSGQGMAVDKFWERGNPVYNRGEPLPVPESLAKEEAGNPQ